MSRPTIAERPSFPEVTATPSELEAVYRFLSDDAGDHRQLLEPHVMATAARCKTAGHVFVLHGPSEFKFPGERFHGQFAFAVSGDAVPKPLGVLHLEALVRAAASKHTHGKPRADTESAYWRSVAEAESRLSPGVAIHVGDRDADDNSLWAALPRDGVRFVFRRGGETLHSTVAGVEASLLREVRVNARRPSRSARMATLHVRSATAGVPRPDTGEGAASVSINVVEVFEPHPPEGEQAIQWTLLTGEPIATADDLARVVDAYRRRWVIEEFFKALKTGCSYEEWQLPSSHALLDALALLAPIAWRLLLLRTLSPAGGGARASAVATQSEIELLRRISVRVKLSDHPTCEEFLAAIAGLGGHLKRNGPPGWQTIWKGFNKFAAAYQGWAARRGQS